MDPLSLFATPVRVIDLPDMDDVNRELSERLLLEEQTAPGFLRSNVGGWHSVPDLSKRAQPCYGRLMQAIVASVDQTLHALASAAGLPPAPRFRYGVQGWAMIMHDGDYVVMHDHGDAHFSTVYYVDAGDSAAEAPDAAGHLALIDPRRSGRTIPAVDLFPSTFTIKPRTGQLVVFPGWLQHYVHTYRGHGPRISISCNLQVEPVAEPAAMP